MKDDEIRALVKAHTDYRADDFGVDNMCGWCGAHMFAKNARHRAGCWVVEVRRAIVTLGKEALARGAKVQAIKELVRDHGCDCDCDCMQNGQLDHSCEDGPCFPCRVLIAVQAEAKLAPATKPGEVECCAGCQYPRVCEGCAELRDAMDGRR